jgi:hypothetical protein
MAHDTTSAVEPGNAPALPRLEVDGPRFRVRSARQLEAGQVHDQFARHMVPGQPLSGAGYIPALDTTLQGIVRRSPAPLA